MRSLGVSRGLSRPRRVSRGLARHHGVSQGFAGSHVLRLIKKPRFEIVAIETIETACTIGDEHALDGTCRTAIGPHLGPSLQSAFADRERLLGGDDQRFLNCDRGVLANLDCISRDLVRPVRVLRWHERILATRKTREVAYPHDEPACCAHHARSLSFTSSTTSSLLHVPPEAVVSACAWRHGEGRQSGVLS